MFPHVLKRPICLVGNPDRENGSITLLRFSGETKQRWSADRTTDRPNDRLIHCRPVDGDGVNLNDSVVEKAEKFREWLGSRSGRPVVGISLAEYW